MPTAIDGSNLGGFLGGRRGSRNRREALRRLLPWARSRRKAVVVFDGPEDSSLARGYGSLEVRWSGARSADSVLIELIIRSNPRNWRIITNDSALAAASRELGAKSESVSSFLDRLPDAGSEGAETPVDVEYWEAWFAAGREHDSNE